MRTTIDAKKIPVSYKKIMGGKNTTKPVAVIIF